MVWAIVSYQSCFCWLYTVSPSSDAKNMINLILVLTIWWCLCVESFLVLLEEGICCGQWVLLANLCWPLPCFILYSKAKFACYSWYLLTSYLCIPTFHFTSLLLLLPFYFLLSTLQGCKMFLKWYRTKYSLEAPTYMKKKSRNLFWIFWSFILFFTDFLNLLTLVMNERIHLIRLLPIFRINYSFIQQILFHTYCSCISLFWLLKIV